MSNPYLKLEHRVLSAARSAGAGRRWLVATSGGVDSMVLAEVCRRWRTVLGDRLVIAHVHHGRHDNRVFRDRAQTLVRSWARRYGLPFVTNHGEPPGARSEASLRTARFAHLERWRLRYGCDVIALAHHRDDLVETRVSRLVRGTGPRGLEAMRALAGTRLRPLIASTRAEIEAYAKYRNLEWLEDPTNADDAHGFRNWVRHQWLPALEARRPGGTAALARSLEHLIERGPRVDVGALTGVRRAPWRDLQPAARAAVAVDYLTSVGAVNYGTSHVLELLKRLDSDRKEFSFKLIGFTFHVSRDLWWASRV